LSGSLIDQQRHNIAFDLQIASITFDLGKAIPCGMIITELISNALKYAFSQGQPGVIKVHLEKEAGMTRLLISDNGVGLSPELDLSHPDTLGLELVSILSRQLKAELQIIRQPGTTFILLFRH
jgi:two-component sensor histidine kinase